MKNNLLYCFMFFIVLAGCKKTPLPETNVGDPVFFFSGQVDGEDVNFQAGNMDYYMQASFYQDASNLYVFKGELSKTCNTPCGRSLKVLIDDYRISTPNGPMVIDSAIRKGPYHFYSETFVPTMQEVHFTPCRPYVDFNFFNWSITTGTMSNDIANTYSLNPMLELGKTYSITLSYNDGLGSCEATHKNVFRIGNPFQTTITVAEGGDNQTKKFSVITDKAATYSYKWEFGDGNTSTMPAPTHTYLKDSTFTTKLTLVNAVKDTCISFYQVYAGNNNVCEANFTAEFMPLNYQQILRSIIVIYTDENGVEYSSAGATQPNGAHIEINSVSDYKDISASESTKKIDLTFDCAVTNGSATKLIKNAHAVLAVSYKKS